MVIITEIDPLDVAEILGQVGGFWDLILIIWPIVFVAASYEAPHLKPRNFRKSVMRVTETATKVLPARVQGSTSFTLEGRMRSQIDTYQEEDLSTWGREAGSSSHQQVNRGGREGWRLCSASHVILRLPGSSIFSFQQVITSTIQKMFQASPALDLHNNNEDFVSYSEVKSALVLLIFPME